MKRTLLLMMTLVLAALGAKAALPPAIEWNYTYNGTPYSGKYDIDDGQQKLKIETNQSGALAAFIAATKDSESVLYGFFDNINYQKLELGKHDVALNSNDFSALNSSEVPALANFKTVDIREAAIESISTMSDMNLSGMEYLRLPSSFDNAPKMASLRNTSKNTALKLVVSTEDTNLEIKTNNQGPVHKAKKICMYSFETNNVVSGANAFNIHLNDGFKFVSMAGYYGDCDLIDRNNNNQMIFNDNNLGAPAVWDFTGANFTACTVSYPQVDSYYAYDDQYEEGTKSAPSGTYETNAFFFFSHNNSYTNAVVDIKLPDVGMEQLPVRSLYDLGKTNKNNYLMIHSEMTPEEFDATFTITDESGNTSSSTSAPLDLVIPNCYTLLDYECALEAHIKSLLIGNGNASDERMIIQGGAFRRCYQLEDLDFVSGISNCWLGDMAFNQCTSMKHIALAEGIVSLGAGCFFNSQHLESIRLPETLVDMGNACFDNCLALSSMTIPSNVERIGKMAFRLCPITDFYLTTTDPEKIPEVWSLGTAYTQFDQNCTFYNSHLWGWRTINGVDDESDKQLLATMTWDQATTWYYSMISGMAVLHFPDELAEKVRASISDTYSAESSDHIKLPMWEDVSKRDNISGADLGSAGTGTWTKDGWAQFLLMKGYKPGGESVVYTKEYSDVWYTMCFPFDLTDEQLAAAFNETFNIADFSGVELVKKTETDPMKMILHFNKVAVTYYKDVYGKIYHRLCEDGTIYRGEPEQTVWREQHGNFKYNVYKDDEGNVYHHVHPTGGNLDKNKTKTFAISNAAGQGNAEEAILIDGILAEAGHPYMIHPAIGVNPGQPKKACNMAGITWKVSPDEKERNSADYPFTEEPSTDDYRDWLFDHMSRTVDLGVESTQQEKWDNYNQAAYTSFGEDHKNYTGQTYTFIGNAREFKKNATVTTKPVLTAVEPKEPKGEPTVVPEPTEVEEPSITLTDNDVIVYSGLTVGKGMYERGAWYGETEITASYNDGSNQWNNFNRQKYIISSTMSSMGYDVDNRTEEAFNYCKNLFNNYASVLAYEQYLEDLKAYNKYMQEKEYYDAWMVDNGATLKQQYQNAVTAYNEALNEWKGENKAAFILIPQYAYFLGTKAGETYPKYFRERAKEEPRTTGLWTQYTAIIQPNDAALAGVEKDLDAKTQSASGSKIAFNEPFFFIDDTPQGITTLIEKIEKEEGKADVQYMDIVVSIDGKIVSRYKTTFEGLPKGVYIINGKKYYVK